MSVSRVLRVISLLVVIVSAVGAAAFLFLHDTQPNGGLKATGIDAIEVPEGFSVIRASTPELTRYPMVGAFDPTGRLFVCESTGRMPTVQERRQSPTYFIRMLEDQDGDGIYDHSQVFADGLSWPQGLVWFEDSLYVASAPDVLRFRDTDGDGRADDRQVVLTGWNLSSNSATLHGPYLSPEGWLYVTDGRHGYSVQTRRGTRLEGKSAGVWRFRPDGRDLEMYSAGGFDNPVELVFLPSGEVVGTMTYFVDPQAGERDALIHWVEGGVYPKPHPSVQEDGLILTGDLMPVMTRFGRVAPSGLARYRSAAFGEDFHNNLFSAQFNTRRVLRHRLFRDGASFRTEDEIFLSSEEMHFHPTDVLEDADGTLLVIDTGGWYSCPITGPGHPDAYGAVYRIGRKDSPLPLDPRGKGINFRDLTAGQKVKYLDDPKPAVRDRATESLVNDGEFAAPFIAALLAESRQRPGNLSAESRARAVFTLYRIGGQVALQAIRDSLSDPAAQVRIAAARCLGLEGDAGALEQLQRAVLSDPSVAVRRQAATALGQIGHGRAVPALLDAADSVEDRFLEHSIIYSLIRLDRPDLLLPVLQNRPASVQKAALMALDQLQNRSLSPEVALSSLTSEDTGLFRAGLLVASRHPEWAGHTVPVLTDLLENPTALQTHESAFTNVLISLCRTEEGQNLIGRFLKPDAEATVTQLMLRAVRGCSVAEFPDSWRGGVRELLTTTQPGVVTEVVETIRFHGLGGYEKELETIAADETLSPELRSRALYALVTTRSWLTPAELDHLVNELGVSRDANRRQLAAAVLGSARLEKEQLLYLARDLLPHSDPLILPQILDVFRSSSDEEVGKALLSSLERFSFGLDGGVRQKLLELLEQYPSNIRTRAETLRADRVEDDANPVSRLLRLEGMLSGGSVARGRMIFFGSRVGCSSCHTVGEEGGRIGPDLTNIGAIRSRYEILESILYPSASLVREFESRRVRTNTETWSGIVQERSAENLVLAISPNSAVRIPLSEIISIEETATSIMPDGLEQVLSDSELADLIAFLEACR